MYNKFIITLNGELRFGRVYLHRDLLPDGDDTCHGGGLWRIDNQRGCLILYGRSFDFGVPEFDKATHVEGDTFPASMGYPMFYLRHWLEQEVLEPITLGESEYERYRRQQIEQFEDDITEGRCYPEMPEGQFVRSK